MQCKWYGCKSGTGNSGFYAMGPPSKRIRWSSVGVILDDVLLTVDFFGRGVCLVFSFKNEVNDGFLNDFALKNISEI